MAILVLFYAATAVFIVGNVYRIVRVARMPAHLRWELYPIPHGPRERQAYGGSYFEDSNWWTKPREHGRASELGYMLKEVLLLKSVRQNQRALWLPSLLFHWGMYLCVATALSCCAAVLVNGESLRIILVVLATLVFWAASTAGFIGAVALIIVRSFSPRLRPFTSRATVLNLAFVAALFGSGLAGLAAGSDVVAECVALLAPGAAMWPLHISWFANLYLSLVSLFLLYFPFTHMTHAYMKFFTYHSVRWDDVPSALNPRANASVGRSLKENVTWAAPHMAGDETKTWTDLVSQVPAGDK